MLVAVLEDSFERFAARFSDVDPARLSLRERVDLFVDRAWEHFSSAHYQSTFEILLNHAGRDDAGTESSWQGWMLDSWDRVWRRLFGESALPKGRTAALQRYTVAVLAGLASLRRLGGDPRIGTGELVLLKETLLRALRRPQGA